MKCAVCHHEEHEHQSGYGCTHIHEGLECACLGFRRPSTETEKPKSWRDVLDAKEMYYNIYKFLPIVKQAGYKFFNCNGLIYELIDVKGVLTFAETGMIVEELGRGSEI